MPHPPTSPFRGKERHPSSATSLLVLRCSFFTTAFFFHRRPAPTFSRSLPSLLSTAFFANRKNERSFYAAGISCPSPSRLRSPSSNVFFLYSLRSQGVSSPLPPPFRFPPFLPTRMAGSLLDRPFLSVSSLSTRFFPFYVLSRIRNFSSSAFFPSLFMTSLFFLSEVTFPL